jgi:hypothetical protein
MSAFRRLDQRQLEFLLLVRVQLCAVALSVWDAPVVAKDDVNAPREDRRV